MTKRAQRQVQEQEQAQAQEQEQEQTRGPGGTVVEEADQEGAKILAEPILAKRGQQTPGSEQASWSAGWPP